MAGGSRVAVAAVLAVFPVASASAATVDRLQSITSDLTPTCAASSPLGAVHPESEWQPQLRVHPVDSDRLAVAWTQGLQAGVVVGVSNDGGLTWSAHAVPVSACGGGEGELAGDAWLAWGADGTLHLVAISAPALSGPTAGPTKIVSTRSSDGGQTWSDSVPVVDDGAFNDRPAVGADPADPDRLYAAWRKTEEDGVISLYTARSSDGGAGWTTPKRAFRDAAGRWVNAPDVQVLADGAVAVGFYVYNGGTDDEEHVIRSTDGGETWADHLIAKTQGDWPRDPELQHDALGAFEIVGNPAPSLAAGPGGSLIAAWQDSTPEQGAILVARSPDGGATWAPPVTVHAQGSGLAWGPTVAVDDAGSVAVSWYDGRADVPGDAEWTGEVWGALSNDDGQTWNELKLGGPFDLRSNPVLNTYLWGNYFGLTPMDGGFGAAFAMGVPAAQTDVFFARLRP